MQPDLSGLEVILTANCNLRCGYCYQNNKQKRRLSWETLQPALDLLLRSRRRGRRVMFIGGEPLLELPLIRKAVDYLEGQRQPNRPIFYVTTTNGMLVNDEALNFFVVHAFTVNLSFDGIQAAQDHRGVGTFATL